jgi:hypothetical protein
MDEGSGTCSTPRPIVCDGNGSGSIPFVDDGSGTCSTQTSIYVRSDVATLYIVFIRVPN